MTDACPTAPAHHDTAGLADRLRRLARAVLKAPALARERRALRLLDDRLLRDIGLTPGQALSEAERPAWDAPRHWQD